MRHGIAGEYGCFITSTGTWWGVENITDKNGDTRAQSADIDVVGISEIDKKAAKEKGLQLVWALALPGKVAPITTAEFIKDTIYNIIKEIYK